MQKCKREITKEMYDRSMKNKGRIPYEEEKNVFTPSEMLGYGLYGTYVEEEHGKYFVYYYLGSSCD